MAMLSIPIPQHISNILQDIKLPGKIVRKDGSDHITLFYFQDSLSMEDILKIIPVVSETVEEINGFNLDVDNYSSFPSGKYKFPIICKIENKYLMKMREKIKKAFDKNDIKYDTKFKEYIPHLTIQYNNKECSGTFDEITWPVKNISLYCGDSNKEKLYIEFPLGNYNKEKYSADFLYDFSEYFKKLASI